MSTKTYILIVTSVVVVVLTSFYSGFFLRNILIKEKPITGQDLIPQQKFRPNFIDEAIFITKDSPHKALILSAIRTYAGGTNNYTIKTFYFDGETWTRRINEGKTSELENVPSTEIVPSWKIENDPSYMLRQTISGEVKLDGTNIKFSIPLIYNEMGIRSFYKYTKFMSEGNASLNINSKNYETYSLYSRIYSFNPPESLVFTSNPAGIETEWLAFWDNNGNFYSIDETQVDDKVTSDSYKAHSLAIHKDELGKIQKSFVMKVSKYEENKLSVNIFEPIFADIDINKLNSVNKSVNNNDIWTTGLIDGFVRLNGNKIKGIGLFEQISQ
jgi:hypothetical protein